jgi:hypothetical protein
MHRLAFLVFAAGLIAAPAAFSGEVYQWKDANGVTHYSQTPPSSGAYQLRQITATGAATAQTAAPKAAEENPNCTAARANVTALSGERPVHEAGADGQPGRALNDAERAAQLDLARAAVKAYCDTPAG